jgi:hypothetical protein
MLKSFLLTAAALWVSAASFAQNTNWSTSNFIGIGTTSPRTWLEVGPTPNGKAAAIFRLNGMQAWGHVLTLATDDPNGDDARMLFAYRNGGKRWALGGSWNSNRFSLWEDAGDGIYSEGFGSERLTILAGGKVGIGITDPNSKLTVNAGENNKAVEVKSGYFNDANTHLFPALSYHAYSSGVRMAASSEIVFADRPGTAGYPQDARTSDILFYTAHTYDQASNAYGVFPDLAMTIKSTQNGANVGIGTPDPDEKLTVKGGIHARSVKVDLNGPLADYVFEADYKLRSLTDLHSYIKRFHHLPEMPSAKEAQSNGLDLGTMNQVLLKKVEELTLYLIRQSKEIKQMKTQISKLKDKPQTKK